MSLNLRYVSYESDNQGVTFCKNVRQEYFGTNDAIGGKNLAVLCYEGTWFSGQRVLISSSMPSAVVK